MSLHVHICKIEIMIAPVSGVVENLRDYGDEMPGPESGLHTGQVSGLCSNKYAGLEPGEVSSPLRKGAEKLLAGGLL